MSEAKHSPGPWEARYVAGAGVNIYADVRPTMGDRFTDLVEIFGTDACQPPRFMIAYERWVQFPKREWGEMQRANAQLMAAAPDLLRVAELVVSWLDEEPGAHKLCDAARAAIAKATKDAE